MAHSFNSRAREGRDVAFFQDALDTSQFQFTRPRGARLAALAHRHAGLCVSIHAPARGATLPLSASPLLISPFQFTRPRGARPNCWCLCRGRSCFNSRAREGRDHIFRLEVINHTMFQFTRPRGARPTSVRARTPSVPFQFTRPRGARQAVAQGSGAGEQVSIHAPARGATDIS